MWWRIRLGLGATDREYWERGSMIWMVSMKAEGMDGRHLEDFVRVWRAWTSSFVFVCLLSPGLGAPSFVLRLLLLSMMRLEFLMFLPLPPVPSFSLSSSLCSKPRSFSVWGSLSLSRLDFPDPADATTAKPPSPLSLSSSLLYLLVTRFNVSLTVRNLPREELLSFLLGRTNL